MQGLPKTGEYTTLSVA